MHPLGALFKTSFYATALAAVSLSAQSAGVSGQGTWETTLHARDINDDGVVDPCDDTTLNVTWVTDLNAKGAMNWSVATAWAVALDVYGNTGWRLPSAIDTGQPGCDYSYPLTPAPTAASMSAPTVRRWPTCTT